MKTSELKKIVEENGYEFKMNANGIDVFIDTTLGRYFYTQDGDSIGLDGRYRIKHHKAITITKALLDYIQTPLNEREDEKKYQLKVNEFNKRIIGVDYIEQIKTTLKKTPEGNQKFIFDNKDIFTQSEIDNFPKEIKGAIECGFLRKVEVE